MLFCGMKISAKFFCGSLGNFTDTQTDNYVK